MFRRDQVVASLGLAVALLLGVGCGGRTLGGPGNNNNVNTNPTDGGGIPDAAIPPDGTTGTCQSEQFEWLRPWRVDSLYLLQDAPVSEGQTVRLAVGLYITGCQRLAQVDYRVEESQRVIYLTAWIWETIGPQVVCPDMEMYVEEILAFPNLSPGNWRVAEQTSGVPGAETWFEVNHCDGNADCFCTSTPPGGGGFGADCNFNCECDPSLQCLAHWGLGGPFSICAHTCSVDADCWPSERCLFTDDGPYAVCEPVPGIDQCPQEGCPPGYDCLQDASGGSWCQAAFDMSDEYEPCSCNEECPTGLRCIDFGGDALPSCHAPCRGDRDCPGGMCGDYLPDTAPICILMWM